MHQKKKYQSPRVLKTVPVSLENELLAGSEVSATTTVTTKGQEVESYDFSQPEFNHQWEN